jgi:hypothetical protein
LSADAELALWRGDPGLAVTNIHAMLVLGGGLGSEPTIISHLVQVAIGQIAVPVTWDALHYPKLTEAQLAALQQAWMEQDFLAGIDDSLAMERAFLRSEISQIREAPGQFRQKMGLSGLPGSPPPSATWFERAGQYSEQAIGGAYQSSRDAVWVLASSYPDELRTMRGLQAMMDASRQARTNGCFLPALQQQSNQLAALGFTNEPVDNSGVYSQDSMGEMLRSSVTSVERFLPRIMNVEASRRLVITATALERYRLRRGNYPPDLTALTPELLPTVPRDPVDGQPLRYRVNSDGSFVLYCIGADGKDDGGNPVPPPGETPSAMWQRGRDWVWPQPATQAEIEASQARMFRK